MTARKEGKIKGCVSLKDQYRHYKENSDSPVDYKTYVKYLKECNLELLNQVVNRSNEVELPYREGKLHVVKYERSFSATNKKNWAVDFNTSKKLGYKVYFDQPFINKWRWCKTNTIVRNKSKYKFTASRLAKRMVPIAINNKVDFPKLN